jgi:osmotically-inducible protein OsmY
MKKTLLIILSPLFLQGCAAAIIAGGGLATAVVANDRRSIDAYTDDQLLETRIQNHLAAHHPTQTELNITSHNRWILLSGTISNLDSKIRIAEDVQKQAKVARVFDETRIAPPNNENTAQDAILTAKVKHQLLQYSPKLAQHIKVVSSGSNVYLMGLVNPEEAKQVSAIAARTEGVSKIITLFDYR